MIPGFKAVLLGLAEASDDILLLLGYSRPGLEVTAPTAATSGKDHLSFNSPL